MGEGIQLRYLERKDYSNALENVVGASKSALRTLSASSPSKYIRKYGKVYRCTTVSDLTGNAMSVAGNTVKLSVIAGDSGNVLGTRTDVNGVAGTFSATSYSKTASEHLILRIESTSGTMDTPADVDLTITTDEDAGGLVLKVLKEYLTEGQYVDLYVCDSGSTYYDSAMKYGGRRTTRDGSEAQPFRTIPDPLVTLEDYQIEDSEVYEVLNATPADEVIIQAKLGETPTITTGIGARTSRVPENDYNNYNAAYFNENGDDDTGEGSWQRPYATLRRSRAQIAERGRSSAWIVYGGSGADNGSPLYDISGAGNMQTNCDCDYEYAPSLDFSTDSYNYINNCTFCGFNCVNLVTNGSYNDLILKDCTFNGLLYASVGRSGSITQCVFKNGGELRVGVINLSDDFVISKCYFKNNTGAILVTGFGSGSISIQDCYFIDNGYAIKTDAAYTWSGTLERCIFYKNTIGLDIDNASTLTFSDSIFYDNDTAVNFPYGGSLGGSLTLDYCNFYLNDIDYPSGATVTNEIEGDPELTDVSNELFGVPYGSPAFNTSSAGDILGAVLHTFTKDTAGVELNGIIFDGANFVLGLRVRDIKYCDIKNYAGQVFISEIASIIPEGTYIDNSKVYDCGSVFSGEDDDTSLQINNCLIYRNKGFNRFDSAPYGGGGQGAVLRNEIINSVFYENEYVLTVGANSSLNVRSSIFSKNDNEIDSEVVIIITHSLSDGLSTGGVDISDDTNLIGDPYFVDSANGDFRLKTKELGFGIDSPCKNSGENGVDMGAYEIDRSITDWGYKLLAFVYNPKTVNEVLSTKGFETFLDAFGDSRPYGRSNNKIFPMVWGEENEANETDRKTLNFIKSLIRGTRTMIDGVETIIKDSHTKVLISFLPNAKEIDSSGVISSQTLTDASVEVFRDEYKGFYLSAISDVDTGGMTINAALKTATFPAGTLSGDVTGKWLNVSLAGYNHYFYILSYASSTSLGDVITLSDPYGYLTNQSDFAYKICQNYRIVSNDDEGNFLLLDPDGTLTDGVTDYHIDFIATRPVTQDISYSQFAFVRDNEGTKRGYSITFEEAKV